MVYPVVRWGNEDIFNPLRHTLNRLRMHQYAIGLRKRIHEQYIYRPEAQKCQRNKIQVPVKGHEHR